MTSLQRVPQIFIMRLPATMWLISQIPMRRTVFSETKAVVQFPHGLSTNGLDRGTDLVNPTAVQQIMYQGRKFLIHEQDTEELFIELRELGKKRCLLLLAGEFSIAKEMYNPIPKFPAEIEFSLASFGKSSFLLDTLMRTPGVPNPIAVVKDKSVLASESLSEVLPLPEIWTEMFRSFYKKADIWFEPLSIPSSMICRGAQVKPFVLTVPMRDEGTYGYAESTMLLQYCLDALGDHFYRNQIHFEGNMESFFLKNASYHVTSSARATDILTVEFWDDEIYSDGVSFNVHKSGRSVFQSRIQFYNSGDLALQRN